MTQVNTERPKLRFHNMSERLHAPIPGFPVASDKYATPMHAEMSENDYPGAGSRSTSAQTSKTVASAKPMAAAPVAPKPSAADIAFAAKTNAKYRHAKVMESPHVKGRERQAEAMLLASCTSGSKYAEAKTIIDELARAPLDIQLAAVERHLKRKAVDQVWSRAYGNPKAPKASVAKPERVSKASDYDDIWTRAYAKPKLAPGNPA